MESQNRQGREEPLEIIQPNPSAKTGPPGAGAYRNQEGFECLQRTRLLSISGQPIPVLSHPKDRGQETDFVLLLFFVRYNVLIRFWVVLK